MCESKIFSPGEFFLEGEEINKTIHILKLKAGENIVENSYNYFATGLELLQLEKGI